MPDRSRVMTQTKRDTLVLQVGVLGVRLTTPPHKKYCYETSRGGQGPPRAVEPMMMIRTEIYSQRSPLKTLTERIYLLGSLTQFFLRRHNLFAVW
jgi:hypothetical protein